MVPQAATDAVDETRGASAPTNPRQNPQSRTGCSVPTPVSRHAGGGDGRGGLTPRVLMLSLLAVLFIAVLSTAADVEAQPTYYIDEVTAYRGKGCSNLSNLNTVTASLRTRLNRARSGRRFTNDLAWPQDFWEACSSTFGSGGLDDLFADAALLSVFAGHGDTGLISFGTPFRGECDVVLATNARLGSMSGAQSGYSMYLAPCTLKVPSLPNTANFQWLRQQFGYHNSPSIGNNQPREFYDMTSGVVNSLAWRIAMEDRPGWFTGDNSPVAVSYGATALEAEVVKNNARLAAGFLRSRRGDADQSLGPGQEVPAAPPPACLQPQPLFFYIARYIDHGSGPCP